jgi:hypothetical protein
VTCQISRRSRGVAPTISPEGHIVLRVRGDAEVNIKYRAGAAKSGEDAR